jgi:hypothetical protein
VLTSAFYESDTPVWPDDTYPLRVNFGVLRQFSGRIGPIGMEALRLSANKQGAPQPYAAVEEPMLSSDEAAQSALVTDSSDADKFSVYRLRLELSHLRQAKIGHVAFAPCELCGRHLPVQLLKVSRIKRSPANARYFDHHRDATARR